MCYGVDDAKNVTETLIKFIENMFNVPFSLYKILVHEKLDISSVIYVLYYR